MVTSTSPHSISVTWPHIMPDMGHSVFGYLVACNSTEDWHIEDVLVITDETATSATCERLVGYTSYQVQVFSFLNSDDGIISVVMYRSETVVVRTLEGGMTFIKSSTNFEKHAVCSKKPV